MVWLRQLSRRECQQSLFLSPATERSRPALESVPPAEGPSNTFQFSAFLSNAPTRSLSNTLLNKCNTGLMTLAAYNPSEAGSEARNLEQ